MKIGPILYIQFFSEVNNFYGNALYGFLFLTAEILKHHWYNCSSSIF